MSRKDHGQKSSSHQTALSGLLLVALSIYAQTAFSAACAQGGQQQQQQQPATRQPVNRAWGTQSRPVRAEQPAEYKANVLDRDVALPNLPAYTGKQVFMNGLTYPNAKQGPGYFVVYNTEHDSSQVKEWWHNALKMDPWKVTYTDASTIKADTKDGSSCTITTGPLIASPSDKAKGMKGSYSVYYHLVQKNR